MYRLLATLISTVCLVVSAQTASSPGGKLGPNWSSLVGEWVSDPTAGGGSGRCTFRFELGGHIMVRTNHAELPAAANRPGGTHDDFMVIFPGKGEGQANYWDNEGHMIEYTASWSGDGNTLTFLSKPGPGPQFRLVYKKLDADSFNVSFEIAAQPGAFKPYTSGKIRRQK